MALADGGRPRTADPGCDVCDHAMARHDAVARRYCSATFDGVLSRGCVCALSAATL